jgi:RPEL repeat
MQDKLDHALQQRPKPEELVKSGILTGVKSREIYWNTTDIDFLRAGSTSSMILDRYEMGVIFRKST